MITEGLRPQTRMIVYLIRETHYPNGFVVRELVTERLARAREDKE